MSVIKKDLLHLVAAGVAILAGIASGLIAGLWAATPQPWRVVRLGLPGSGGAPARCFMDGGGGLFSTRIATCMRSGAPTLVVTLVPQSWVRWPPYSFCGASNDGRSHHHPQFDPGELAMSWRRTLAGQSYCRC